MKIISFIPPWYYIKKVTSRNDVSMEITNFQRDPFLKVHSILSVVVSAISYPHI